MELHGFTPVEEIDLRIKSIQSRMPDAALDGILISTNANIYYTAGRVFNGYVFIPAQGRPIYLVRRPNNIEGDGVTYIHKPEQIAEVLKDKGYAIPENMGLEMATTDYLTIQRLMAAFPECRSVDASAILRQSRSVKTNYEVEQIRKSALKHCIVYNKIPKLYDEGMSDIELQIEIEHASRLVPTPYDFSMGGAGLDPSMPVGADGTIIKPGMTVMVDTNGDFDGYMSDLTRVYSLGNLSELALKAHRCSIDICRMIEKEARPGVKASALYEMAVELAKSRSLEHYFMGYSQKAGFIGHGVGIEINELPVLSPKSRDIIALNNVIALEPKFVIPETGAVGIENTYVVKADGLKCLTEMTEEIINLEK